MAEPRVSICVPTIGRTEYLAHTRDSISAQTFSDFEVLVLDNASSADSEALIAQWAATDGRIRVLRVEPRVPMFENFNRGIRAARGEYLTFCHDDDLLAPDMLKRHVAFLDAHSRIGFSGSNYEYVDERGLHIEHRRPIHGTEIWDGWRYIRALMRSGRNPLTMQSVFYRREALGSDGIDVKLPIHYGDFVLLMRIAERWDVGLIDEPLCRVRKHSGQASSTMSLRLGMQMRTDVLHGYLDELATRQSRFRLMELYAALGIAHRTGLLWGWVNAPDTAEALACTAAFGQSPVDMAIAIALRGIDFVAPPNSSRRGALISAARSFANG